MNGKEFRDHILLSIGFILVWFIVALLQEGVGVIAAISFVIGLILFLAYLNKKEYGRRGIQKFITPDSSKKRLKKERKKHISNQIVKLESKINETKIELKLATEAEKIDIKQKITNLKKQKSDFQNLLKTI